MFTTTSTPSDAAPENQRPFDSLPSEHTQRLLFALCSKDAHVRREARDGLLKVLQPCQHQQQQQPVSYPLLPRQNGVHRDAAVSSIQPFALSTSSSTPSQLNSSQLEAVYGLLRLLHDSPFTETRDDCADIIQMLKNDGIEIPRPFKLSASSFISESDIEENQGLPEVSKTALPTETLFADLFARTGRLDRFVRVMAMHPSYMESFVKAHVYIMLSEQGPLPLNYRFYIGIMAASRHHCCYLVHKLILEFTLHGGDASWLSNVANAPAKLRSLNLINRLMAHKPWTIDRRHIEALTKGSDPWSVSELFHALVILAHFHSLCSFVFGCGVNPELDHPEAAVPSTCSNCSSSSNSPSPTTTSGADSAASSRPASSQQQLKEPLLQVVLERMRQLNEESIKLEQNSQNGDCDEMITDSLHHPNQHQQQGDDNVALKFREVEAAAADLHTGHSVGDSTSANPNCPIVARLLCDDINNDSTASSNNDACCNSYVDFCSRSSMPYPPLKAQDFSWQESACSLANQLYAEVGDVLDEKLRIIQNLTYKTFCDCANVDTALFRRAIWYYVHCLYGIRHDDFDYQHINQLLESRRFKMYLKVAACYPERMRRDDFVGWLLDFQSSEKVHISLMIAEARLESELIYVLRAFNAFLMPS